MKIGDRVEVLPDARTEDAPIGARGTVIEARTSTVLVRFDAWYQGHGKDRREFFLEQKELKIVGQRQTFSYFEYDYVAASGLSAQPVSRPLFPASADERKQIPLASGVLDYFPAALIEVAKVSYAGNQQHNPGQPLHWSRGKSTDQADTIVRHFLERGSLDTDGVRHTAKLAWRVLALLQLELEAEGAPVARNAYYDEEKK